MIFPKKVTKKHILISFFIFALLSFLSFLVYNKISPTFTRGGAIYTRDIFGRIIEAEQVPSKSGYQAPKPLPYVPPTEPVYFQEVNTEEQLKSFYKDASQVFVETPLPFTCLNEVENLDNRVKDDYLLGQIRKIENFRFSDEIKLLYEDGHTQIENKGERSVRTVTFLSVCKTNTHYFFLFQSYGPKVHIGGGGSEPTHFAYTDLNNNFVLIEEPSIANKSIKAPGEYGGVPYYGCRTFYGFTENYAYYSCGGGDGPGGAGSLFQINLGTKRIIEKDYCQFGISAADENYVSCYDENSKQYYHFSGARN